MQSRRPITSANHRSRGGALGWTLALMGGVAVAQLALFLTLHPRPDPLPAAGPAPASPPSPAAAVPPLVPPPSPPPPAPASATVEPAPTPMPKADPESRLPRPRVVPPSPPPRTTDLVADPEAVPVPAPSPAPAQPPAPTPPASPDPAALARDDVRVLVADAIQQRRNGDMGSALAKLSTAAELQPGHPRILFEQAATYEAMGLADKALATFSQIVALGPARAGTLHGIAQRRLHDGLRTVGTTAPNDADLFVGDIQEIRHPETPGVQRVDLRVDLHGRPGKKINPSDVFLSVQFFDLVNDTRAEPTRADPPRTRWTSEPVDWNDPAIETVEVSYSLPDPPPGSPTAAERRVYLGYLVELYYQDALLDVVAQPRRLARFQARPAPDSPPPAAEPRARDPLGGGLLEDAPPAPPGT